MEAVAAAAAVTGINDDVYTSRARRRQDETTMTRFGRRGDVRRRPQRRSKDDAVKKCQFRRCRVSPIPAAASSDLREYMRPEESKRERERESIDRLAIYVRSASAPVDILVYHVCRLIWSRTKSKQATIGRRKRNRLEQRVSVGVRTKSHI